MILCSSTKVAKKSHANLLKEKEIELLAQGLEEQNVSHLEMDQNRLAHKHHDSGNDGAVNRLLKQRPDTTSDRSGLTITTMTTSAVETSTDTDTPGRSGT